MQLKMKTMTIHIKELLKPTTLNQSILKDFACPCEKIVRRDGPHRAKSLRAIFDNLQPKIC